MSYQRAFYAALLAASATPPSPPVGPIFGPDIAYDGATMLQASEIVLPGETGLFWGTGDYTHEFWARCTGSSAVGYIQGDDDADNRVLSLMPIGGSLYFDSGNDTAGRLSCGWPNSFPNRLIHYALQVDTSASQMRLYVDGYLFAQQNSYALRTGVANTLRLLGTNVQFGEMRYWNYVRTASQILATRDLSLRGPHAGLVASWPLEARGASGTVSYDYSGNNYHGIIA